MSDGIGGQGASSARRRTKGGPPCRSRSTSTSRERKLIRAHGRDREARRSLGFALALVAFAVLVALGGDGERPQQPAHRPALGRDDRGRPLPHGGRDVPGVVRALRPRPAHQPGRQRQTGRASSPARRQAVAPQAAAHRGLAADPGASSSSRVRVLRLWADPVRPPAGRAAAGADRARRARRDLVPRRAHRCVRGGCGRVRGPDDAADAARGHGPDRPRPDVGDQSGAVGDPDVAAGSRDRRRDRCLDGLAHAPRAGVLRWRDPLRVVLPRRVQCVAGQRKWPGAGRRRRVGLGRQLHRGGAQPDPVVPAAGRRQRSTPVDLSEVYGPTSPELAYLRRNSRYIFQPWWRTLSGIWQMLGGPPSTCSSRSSRCGSSPGCSVGTTRRPAS